MSDTTDHRGTSPSSDTPPRSKKIFKNIVFWTLAVVPVPAFFDALSRAEFAGASLIALSIASCLALTSVGQNLLHRRGVRIPGVVLFIAATVLLFSGALLANGESAPSTVAQPALAPDQQLAQAKQALQIAKWDEVEDTLRPLTKAKDPRAEPLVLAARALRDANGDRTAAARKLKEGALTDFAKQAAYDQAITEIDPALRGPLDKEFAAIAAQREGERIKAVKLAETERARVEEEEELQRLFNRLDGSNRAVSDIVKQGMNDPSSFKHVSSRAVKLGDGNVAIFMIYRGTNGFGAVMTERVRAVLTPKGEVLSVVTSR